MFALSNSWCMRWPPPTHTKHVNLLYSSLKRLNFYKITYDNIFLSSFKRQRAAQFIKWIKESKCLVFFIVTHKIRKYQDWNNSYFLHKTFRLQIYIYFFFFYFLCFLYSKLLYLGKFLLKRRTLLLHVTFKSVIWSVSSKSLKSVCRKISLICVLKSIYFINSSSYVFQRCNNGSWYLSIQLHCTIQSNYFRFPIIGTFKVCF